MKITPFSQFSILYSQDKCHVLVNLPLLNIPMSVRSLAISISICATANSSEFTSLLHSNFLA